MLDTLKTVIRVAEAVVTPRLSHVRFDGHDLRFVRSIWWHDAYQASFDAEILPYLAPLSNTADYAVIVDAGAATGLFAVAAALRFPQAHIHGFEPSLRQRIMLGRNLALNHVVGRVDVHAFGLWNSETLLAFRTHGAMSAFLPATELSGDLAFTEHVPVMRLDTWVARQGLERLDLIKMDIEGAEIEALEGARSTLTRLRPELLVQAYHKREHGRTFERCAEFLRGLGYRVQETPAGSGQLHATGR